MAAMWRSLQLGSKMLFSANSLIYRSVVLHPEASQRRKYIAAAFYSCFRNQRHGFREVETTRLIHSNHVPFPYEYDSLFEAHPLLMSLLKYYQEIKNCCEVNDTQSEMGKDYTEGQIIPCVPASSISTSASLKKYYVKPNYLKKWGRRDMKRREMFKDYEVERSGLRMIKKSDILPSGVRQKAAEELSKLPLNSSLNRVRNRCVLTDRARGIVGRFKVSRMMFRYFAEKGQISGVQKAQW